MVKKTLFFVAVAAMVGVANSAVFELESLPGECWWGAATTFGRMEPLGVQTNSLSHDLRVSNLENQAAPVFVSNKGRWIWCDGAFKFDFKNGKFKFESDSGEFDVGQGEPTLRGAFRAVAKKHFPPSGKCPDLDLIAKPQWNTWIELTYNQNQKDILAYAKAIGENGFPTGGVIMIDDTWQYGYGIWEFDPRRFSDPKAMCKQLHDMGLKIMLWVCPYVSMDSPGYREMAFGVKDAGVNCKKGGLLCINPGDPAPIKWWNGKSATIDFTHPLGAKWFARKLQWLIDEFGVDGFKLDAGDIEAYPPEMKAYAKGTVPADMCEAYAKIGLEFPLNEYRACWKMGGQPIVQRLCDKGHNWRAVQQLIPDMITAGLLGHSFVCPDMIGGGSWKAFAPDAPTPYDPELFVRSAQVHALCPMMQFSAAPWRMLKGENLDAVRAAAWTRQKFAGRFVELAKECAKTGEPMLRNLEYSYPGHGWENVKDQFLMGDFLLVAPQIVKGARERTVIIPPGTWKGDDGVVVVGPKTITVKTPISRIPYFEKVK